MILESFVPLILKIREETLMKLRMKKKCLPVVLLVLGAGLLQAQTPAANEAAAIGATVKSKITIGEGYVTGTESVEARMTVLDVLRGEKAWELVKANPSNKPPEAGMEFVAVRIRIEYGDKGSGDPSYGIRAEQFAAVSEKGRQYDRPAVSQPNPELSGRLYPGDSLEGWIALLVSVDDAKPLMSFGNNYYRIWFKLY